jgi:hypothetical protein
MNPLPLEGGIDSPEDSNRMRTTAAPRTAAAEHTATRGKGWESED